MNGIKCDNCGAGYRPNMLADCIKCKGEFCDTCHRDHGCKGQ
jgi:DNA polymerase II large subunit